MESNVHNRGDGNNSDVHQFKPGDLGKQRKVLEVLGEGSFGKVFKCHNLQTGNVEAVKVMKNCFNVTEMAKQEIENLKRLQSPDSDAWNIVRFNGFFFHEDQICLSFEVLDVDLYGYMQKTGAYETGLDLWEVKHITRQLLCSLQHLKTMGMMHADIKPGNVMVVEHQEKPPRVKLVDFGGAQESSRMDPEKFICTDNYSSPEMLLSSEVNQALDMWSLGATAFELAAGTDLFPFEERHRVLDSIQKIFGQIPDHVLDRGEDTEAFFTKSTEGVPRWTLRTLEEFDEGADVFNSFEDVEDVLSARHGQDAGLDLFLDLLKKMLQVDPHQRIPPLEALQHPFFSVQEEGQDGHEETPQEPRLQDSLDVHMKTSAVDQLEDPEHVHPRTAVPQEDCVDVQTEDCPGDQLRGTQEVQTEDGTVSPEGFVEPWSSVLRVVARAAETLHSVWVHYF